MRFTYAPGTRPLEGYTIQNGIGRGGFGEVYHAVSDGGKEVALKLVQRNLDVELRGVGQCLNLKHPNLLIVYDVKQSENGDNWAVGLEGGRAAMMIVGLGFLVCGGIAYWLCFGWPIERRTARSSQTGPLPASQAREAL